jgi:glutamate synthase domain-containing protein 2
VIGTAELVAMGCVRCANCESGRGCPRGIATTDPELLEQLETEWAAQRLINLYSAWRQQLGDLMSRYGMKDVSELRGRIDLLRYDGVREVKA